MRTAWCLIFNGEQTSPPSPVLLNEDERVHEELEVDGVKVPASKPKARPSELELARGREGDDQSQEPEEDITTDQNRRGKGPEGRRTRTQKMLRP